jgi:ATP-dependent DNA helicase RecG
MADFLDNKIKILVATAVVEVGIDVPNATVMVIEGAERFGLAQLHQFRGRVGRGHHQSYCYALSESGAIPARLKAFAECADGFELAERDLTLRGPGERFGVRQSGVDEMRFADSNDLGLLSEAQEAARGIVATDPSLAAYPALAERVRRHEERIHLE